MRQIREFRSDFENISRDFSWEFAQHSYECHFILFSSQIVAKCSHVFSRLSHDRRKTFVRVSQKFCIVNSPNFMRLSCEIFWPKNSNKIFKHLKPSRPVRD